MPREFKKAEDPYLFDTVGFSQLLADDRLWGGHFIASIIAVKGQTWPMTRTLLNVTAILHYKDDAYALRVGYDGDPYAGHIGMAYCPFVAGVPVVIRHRDGRRLSITPTYVHPIPHAGMWAWRVEYNNLRELEKE